MSETVGFIGIGIMGGGMVRNLAKAGLKPLVWNRTRRRLDKYVAEGFEVAEDPAALAAASDVIIICVSDTPDVEKVVLGERGVIEGVRAGSLVIDMSTISPQATVEMGKRLAEKDVRMLDAPISGGSEGAAKGTLSIMVGGRRPRSRGRCRSSRPWARRSPTSDPSDRARRSSSSTRSSWW